MFVLVTTSSAFGAAEQVTYAHEFNHALQDQHFDLNKLAPKHPDQQRPLARRARAGRRRRGPAADALGGGAIWPRTTCSSLPRGASGGDDSLARVPLVVRTELLFPYVEGFNFVRQAYRQAGNSYAAVDELFENPPESTAQILHPDKYRDQVQPDDVQLRDVAGDTWPDWRTVGSGVLGELDTRVLLEQWGTDHCEAVRVAGRLERRPLAAGRKGRPLGDRHQVDLGVPEAARAFFSAYTRGLRTRFDSATIEESSATRQALTDARRRDRRAARRATTC